MLGFGDLDGEGFEFADESAELSGGVDPDLVALGLIDVEGVGDGLACDFVGPGRVGPVKLRWFCTAAAAGVLASGVPHDDAAG